MEKTKKQFTVNNEIAEEFMMILPGTGDCTVVPVAEKFTITMESFNGTIEIRKSGRVAYNLQHKNFPSIEDEIVGVDRFSSKKSLLVIAEKISAACKALTEKADKLLPVEEESVVETTKKEKKSSLKHGKNELGHIRDTISDKIDQMFLKGTTEAELIEAGITPVRFKGHFKHLLKDKADRVDVKLVDGVYKAELLG